MNIYKIICAKGEMHGFALEYNGSYLGHLFLEGEDKSDAGIIDATKEHLPPADLVTRIGLPADELLLQVKEDIGEDVHLEHLSVI